MIEPLYIKDISPERIVLSDNSIYQFWPGMEPQSSWESGDRIEKSEKEGRIKIFRFINITKQKQEAGGIPVNNPELSKSNGPDVPADVYSNLDSEIRIKRAEGELIWLEDNSKWQMYNPALASHGDWNAGDTVIVTQRMVKSKDSKRYEMKNLATGKELISIYLGYEK